MSRIVIDKRKQHFIKQAVYNKWTGCLEWKANINSSGYAQAKIGKKVVKVHRWLLEQKLNRVLSTTELALHKCNNRQCISTAKDHVVNGNRLENTRDSIIAGTHYTTNKSRKPWKH